MIRLLTKHLLLATGRLLLLCVTIFLILRSAETYYERDLSFVEFIGAVFSGRLVRAPGLPPLATAFLYSQTTIVLALVLSYGFGGPLGIILGRYRMIWAQILGHLFISVALATPAFLVAYAVLYVSIADWGIFIGGESALAPGASPRTFAGQCLLLAIPLSFPGIALIARQVSQTVFNAFPEGSLTAFRSLGIPQRLLFDRVIASAIWSPLLRTLPFLLSLFLSVLIVTETAFFVPGFGYSIFKAAQQSDLQSLAVLSLWSSTALLLANSFVDILEEWLHSRNPSISGTK
ncbi:MAG: ABC-type dipeptide/oligopeptide/nickel transport system, permease component [Verrucomicrobia bacterium]|nr:MAG: ABC-type dipeptide/oligopeptide/nickel transport system, permease component [Verrucomicrobiota bacterium]